MGAQRRAGLDGALAGQERAAHLGLVGAGWRDRSGSRGRAGRRLARTVTHFRMLTARATTRSTVTSETEDCSIISILAQRDSGITSVGLKAVELVNER